MLFFFFFNDTATTEIYTLSLHDALPICGDLQDRGLQRRHSGVLLHPGSPRSGDRKSTRLNSSHLVISYAVFCLKKKTAARLREDGAGGDGVRLRSGTPGHLSSSLHHIVS